MQSSTKTFARSRTLSSNWNCIHHNPEIVRQHLDFMFGQCVLLQLSHPLMDFRTGRIHLWWIKKRNQLSLNLPISWVWFAIIGCFNGYIFARYSADMRSSNIIIWNPVTGARRFIRDPDDYPRNPHCILAYNAQNGEWFSESIPTEPA
ncbi:hypothetical protein PIB30_093270 [Stylosanthes scabra]|uniref:Uncharacterized protein n=1 Tax=Stylosanthes scabra TaxID=79078 RepID=A0ABU6VWY3_9FABA|nr:hypothetical protein [Stylosanthes scabra]